MARATKGTGGGSARGRNRASPASLFKLYKKMTRDQRKLVRGVGFGNFLKIGSGRLPSAKSKWLLKNLDAEKSGLSKWLVNHLHVSDG